MIANIAACVAAALHTTAELVNTGAAGKLVQRYMSHGHAGLGSG